MIVIAALPLQKVLIWTVIRRTQVSSIAVIIIIIIIIMSLASGTSGKDRPHTPSSKSRYQRLHHHHHPDHDSAAESIVEVADPREMTASPGTIFRSRGVTTMTPATTASTTPDRPSWTALSTEDLAEKERRSDEEDDDQDSVHNNNTSRSHQSLVSGLSPNTSREWLDEDELQDDDDMIRRYHHVIHTRVPTLPAEFSGKESRGNTVGLGVRMWAALGELRQGARQRRAARLLNPNSRHDFCQTWFCDATDRGIALAAALTAAWLVAGILTHARAGYWWTGFVLFVIRVSARSVYEAAMERKRLRKRNSTMPLHATATVTPNHSLELSAGNANGGPKSNNLYRDQEGQLMTPMV